MARLRYDVHNNEVEVRCCKQKLQHVRRLSSNAALEHSTPGKLPCTFRRHCSHILAIRYESVRVFPDDLNYFSHGRPLHCGALSPPRSSFLRLAKSIFLPASIPLWENARTAEVVLVGMHPWRRFRPHMFPQIAATSPWVTFLRCCYSLATALPCGDHFQHQTCCNFYSESSNLGCIVSLHCPARIGSVNPCLQVEQIEDQLRSKTGVAKKPGSGGGGPARLGNVLPCPMAGLTYALSPYSGLLETTPGA